MPTILVIIHYLTTFVDPLGGSPVVRSTYLQNAPALGVAEQLVGGSELCDAAIRHDEDAVAVHDGVEPVGDGQHRAVPEPLPGNSGLVRPVALMVKIYLRC